MPSPPALAVAAVSVAPLTQPMPVCTTGRRTPTSWQNRVVSAACGPFGTSLIRDGAPDPSLIRDFPSGETIGIDLVAQQRHLIRGRSTGLGDVVG